MIRTRFHQDERVITALLTEPTQVRAAARAGISTVTLWRRLRDPEFARRYREARRQSVSQAIARLQQASSQAVDTLCQVMQSRKAAPSARVAAARTVLELTIRAGQVEDLEERLAEVERLLREVRI